VPAVAVRSLFSSPPIVFSRGCADDLIQSQLLTPRLGSGVAVGASVASKLIRIFLPCQLR
jgi:hypothetical protein